MQTEAIMSKVPAKSDREYEEIPESARQLAVSEWFIKDLLRKKKLTAKKAGRRTIVNVQSRKDYANSLPDAEFAPPRLRRRAESTTSAT
jgi:hypothetical protein